MFVEIPGGQSLEQIITDNLGYLDEAVFEQVVQVNNLDYPYIQQSAAGLSAYATGQVTITNPTSSSVTVPTGTTVSTSAPVGGISLTYTTASSVTILSTGNRTVNVTCTIPGPSGNIGAGKINSVSGFPALTVTNLAPISGGYIYNILTPGMQLWLPDPGAPSTSSPTAGTTHDFNYYFQNGGTDFALTSTGGLLFSSNDISITSGLQNVTTDLLCRLRTPIGMLPWNLSAGSYLSSLIGQNNTPNIINKINAMAKDSVFQDSRIANVATQVLSLTPTFVTLSVSAQLNNGLTLPVQRVAV